MGKKGLSDKVRTKRKEKAKQPPNPFEVKVNKVKHVVVNKKVQSWEKGRPGVSRSKAVQRRKDTLIRELHHSKKSNSLLDKRFGEGDSTLTADEKMVQRFAMEKKKQMRGTDFNLDDNEEILTHYGQSLAENLQDTIGSDSEDDEQAVKNLTGDLQFGGLSREESGLSWKDRMKDIIADSKKMKYERQAEKEKVAETTNELDTTWKTVVPSLKTVMQRPPPNKKVSNYMQLFHNLVREQTSVGASDKLKTDEEKAKEEAEKLQILEAQRLSRMRGDSDKPQSNHVSADDLNDGFSFEKKKNKVSFSGIGVANEGEDSDGQETSYKEEEEENEEEASGDSDEEEDGEDEDTDDDEGSDNFSDLASNDDEDDEEDEKEDYQGDKSHKGKSEKKLEQSASGVKSILKKSEVPVKTVKDSGAQSFELPFVFAAPGSYEELAALLHGHSTEEQATILSRLRKCHHPSLAEGNKDKLEKILQYLLHYFGELVSKDSVDKSLVNQVTSHVWEMTQMFPATSAAYLQKFILDKQRESEDSQQRKNGKASLCGVDTLLHLSLIVGLFPTSDFRHPITTPTINFIAQMLSECSVRSVKDCITGLFLSAQAIEFVGLSKRYIPEVVIFLHGILVLGADENEASGVKVFPPLKNNSRRNNMLQVKEKCEVSADWSITELLSKDPKDLDTDKLRCEAMVKCVQQLQECLNLWVDLPDLAAVLKPFKEPLSMLPVQNYSDRLQKSIQVLKSKIRESEAKKLQAMQQPSKRPEPLKLFEPKVEEFWSGKKKKGGPNREANERQRLMYKVKRERKAAIREIKRDNEVLASHQLEVASKKDAERKRKTKELMNSLANQEGDYNAIKRAKH